MKAKDVMTRYVISITPDSSIAQAIARMVNHGVSGMPVIDEDGRLLGMITESDFLRRVETDTDSERQSSRRWGELLLGAGAGAEVYSRTHGRRVRDVMSEEVITASPDASLGDIVGLMEQNAIKRIPVLEDGRVVGVVSRSDLMTAVAERLNEVKPHPASDQAIRARISSEMKQQTWAPLHSVKVTVHEGIVELNGIVYDERQRSALHVLVRNVDGVSDIRDKLKYIEPMSASSDEP